MMNANIKNLTILSGGSAMKDIMFELLKHPYKITRVVPSTDNGASSKELRDAFQILSVGDIRQSMATAIPHYHKNKALVKFINWRFPLEHFIPLNELTKLLNNPKSVLYQISSSLSIQETLMEYLSIFAEKAKHSNINLSNGSIGNFLLVGSYFKHHEEWSVAIEKLENIFCCLSTVLPTYLNNHYHLKANFSNGSIIYGESEIAYFCKQKEDEISSLEICELEKHSFKDTDALVNPKVIHSIQSSDLIVYGPGSFFTSILPHMINLEFPIELAKRKVKKVFLLNLVQDSETLGYSAYDIVHHIEKIAQQRGYKISDFITDIIINNHYSQKSFYNDQKEEKSYIQLGNLENYKNKGLNIIIQELEDPWKRGEFDPKAVVDILLNFIKE